ncbi:MAG: outer membrane beta-barrel protein [Bdellovibrionales bacterium]|nr:outer membrane beta-barrel protein [Bdellovibrionales bacterium]
MRVILFSVLLFSSMPAFAGFIELGASANYRSSGYNEFNKIESLTYTASFSYYFFETCALEFNYTTGYSKQLTKGPGELDDQDKVEDNIDMASTDLVLSFAGRQDPFRPYIKAGAGYLIKERFRQINNGDKNRLYKQEGIVPSGGVGLSINLTKELSVKIGIEAWTSPLKQKPVVVDYAGRAGIAWIF